MKKASDLRTRQCRFFCLTRSTTLPHGSLVTECPWLVRMSDYVTYVHRRIVDVVINFRVASRRFVFLIRWEPAE
jgi:hypothetical protein